MGQVGGKIRVNQLERELFEQARRELGDILDEKAPALKREASLPSAGRTIIMHGPVTIQRLVIIRRERRAATVAPLRSETEEVAWH